jgi:hypothetical protein
MNHINYIFIDFENVQETDFDRIAGKPVKVVLVLGERHKNLPVTLVKLIKKYSTQVDLVETALNGKNALDFVLAYEIGALSAKDPSVHFSIISKDKGFDALVKHLKSKGMFADRYLAFSEIPGLMNPNAKTPGVCAAIDGVKIPLPLNLTNSNSAVECGKQVAALLKANPKNRPKKLKSLAAVIRVRFAEKLSPDELKQTINELIRLKVITLSATGEVAYPN